MVGRVGVAISQFANARGYYLGRRSGNLHARAYRWSRGRIGAHLPGLPGARVLLLDHVGAKTGTRRTSPVMYHQDDDRFAIVASKAGEPTNPAWFHNLKANPETTIRVGRDVLEVRARVATDEERAQLWPHLRRVYPGYEFFERRAAPRRIPVVILDPKTGP